MQKGIKILGAAALIGDGIVWLLDPAQYSRFWRVGPQPCRDIMESLAERPALTRCLALLEIGAGLWLAKRHLN